MRANRATRRVVWLAGVLGLGTALELRGDTFGSGANEFTIDFSEIGDPGNPEDTGTTGAFGAVNRVFRMGTYEVSRDMVIKASNAGGLGMTLGDLSSSGGNGADRPATGVGWSHAARFVNWLNDEAGFAHAYKFLTQPGEVGYVANENIELWAVGDIGFDPANPFRNTEAYYFLPNEDEWYKAAYYSGSGTTYFDYATESDTAPTSVTNGTGSGTAVYLHAGSVGPTDVDDAGGLGPYGTMGQNGNVWEWLEDAYDGTNDAGGENRAFRGGSWFSIESDLRSSDRFEAAGGTGGGFEGIGFRVASLPEPSSMVLTALGAAALLGQRRRKTVRSS